MQEVKLPQLGQSVEEASIVEWHKQEGEPVEEGELLFSIQTDKAEIECESTASGVVRKILVAPDVEVPVMTVVALVGDPDEPLPDLGQYGAEAATAPSAEETVLAESAPAPVETVAAVEASPTARTDSGRLFVSPRARAQAQALGVDAAFASGSGAMGRVMEADVRDYADRASQVRITPTARRMAQQIGVDITRVTGNGPRGKVMKADVAGAPRATKGPPAEVGALRRPLTPMRRIIAERMVDSKFSAPHYYISMEIDMAAAAQFREGAASYKPTYNELILFAVSRAIREHPGVNARWGGDAIEEPSDIHLGFAMALPEGLIVPVVRSVQDKSLDDIHRDCAVLIEKARAGKLTPDDYTGSTFTISNLGAYGVDQFTAIINQPNSAILAIGRIKEKPVVIEGDIGIRPMMNVTLSSDHRVIDGAVAAEFMATLREILEAGRFRDAD